MNDGAASGVKHTYDGDASDEDIDDDTGVVREDVFTFEVAAIEELVDSAKVL